MEKVEVVIVGAGIVGLAVAAEVSRRRDSVYALERHDSFGRETSSRNSEVIHAGIYYPPGSLKARMCIGGNELIYETCEKNNIPHKKTGKLIVAANDSEAPDIMKLFDNAKASAAEGLEILTEKGIKELEPNIKAKAAIYSKRTGIVDSHRLMKYYAFQAERSGAVITYKAEVRRITKTAGGYEVVVLDASNDEFKFLTDVVINCAGLESDTIAQMAGIDIGKEGYRLKYCKGQYFNLPSQKSRLISRLIYPVPRPRAAALGIHATPNLAGIVRLGPDDEYIERPRANYDVDTGARIKFYDSASAFLPFLEKGDLSPDTAGIRPKLQGPEDAFRDFVIKEESALGLAGFINLIGIESPGLTGAPAIAKYVAGLLR